MELLNRLVRTISQWPLKAGAIVLTATALACSVSGCGAGTNFSQSEVDQLQPGVTTYDQAVAKLGQPYRVSDTGAGGRLAIWSFAGLGSAKAVGIRFGANGVMEAVTSRSDTSGTSLPPSSVAAQGGSSARPLGITAQRVPDSIAGSLKITGGAMVVTVTPSSVAERGGIKVGDVITAFNGVPISSTVDLGAQTRSSPPNGAVLVVVQRGSQQLPLTLQF